MLKSLFFRLCYRLGFYPTKVKAPEELYAYLKSQSTQIKEYELSRLSYAIAFSRDQKYYNTLLKKFVPKWKTVTLEKAKFIGEGYGGSSLDAYRWVQINNKTYFEKVYFNTHVDLEKIQWLQKNIADFLKEKINFPYIQKVYSGKLLSIVYFEFLELTKPGQIEEKELIKITKDLYQLSQKHAAHLVEIKKPEAIGNFTYHHQYKKYAESAHELLGNEVSNSGNFEELAEESKKVLTHGDIQKTNVYQNGILLDWDSFGIYPIGLDPSFLFFRLLFKEGLEDDPETWLEENYRSLISKEDWEDFKRNFTYFLFVFSMELFLEDKMIAFKNKLLEKLRTYM